MNASCHLAVTLFAVVVLAAAAPAQGPRGTAVVVATVHEGKLETKLRVVGQVEARVRTVLAAQVDGRVAEPPLREGSSVSTAEKPEDRTVVCRLDRTDRELQLREAVAARAAAAARAKKMRAGYRVEEIEARRADVEEQRAVFENAEATFERTRKLYETKVVERDEFDRVQSLYLVARSALTRAESDLRLAEAGFRDEEVAEADAELARHDARVALIEDELAKTAVRTPVSGVVVRRLTQVGQWVTRGGPVAEIVDLSRVRIRTSVVERVVSLVRPGDAVSVQVDAYGERQFSGIVEAVVPAAEQGTRTFPVWIDLPNEDGALMDGMFARITISAGEPRTVRLVPKDAIVLTSRGPVVFRVVDGKQGPEAVAVPVEVGTAVEGDVEIRRGEIEVGAPIVVEGNERLSPMRPQPVEPVERGPGR